jgi:hypothetical protein
MKRALLLLCFPLGLWAQEVSVPVAPVFEEGMTVEGLRSPFYDASGALVAELTGGRARVVSAEVADVEQLRVDLFETGERRAQVYAPACRTRMETVAGVKQLVAESEGWVLVVTDSFALTGRGFRLDTRAGRFEVFNEVKVLGDREAWSGEGLSF